MGLNIYCYLNQPDLGTLERSNCVRAKVDHPPQPHQVTYKVTSSGPSPGHFRQHDHLSTSTFCRPKVGQKSMSVSKKTEKTTQHEPLTPLQGILPVQSS